MISVLWATKQYWIWLVAISLCCLLLERFWPWRKKQKLLRRQFGQDLLWLVINGHAFSITLAFVIDYFLLKWIPFLGEVKTYTLIQDMPFWIQLPLFFVLFDFLQWCVHNLLHRVEFLWQFHKLHHSIEELDWIGNFRFHWMEIVIYKLISYLPLVLLLDEKTVILPIAIISTVIGDLNHSNLNITWGPLRYVLNSPRMHVWHHMKDLPDDRPGGVNFGISLSLWDWLFGTVYWPNKETSPDQQPEKLGFPDMNKYPLGFFRRLIYPLRLPHFKSKRRGQ